METEWGLKEMVPEQEEEWVTVQDMTDRAVIIPDSAAEAVHQEEEADSEAAEVSEGVREELPGGVSPVSEVSDRVLMQIIM